MTRPRVPAPHLAAALLATAGLAACATAGHTRIPLGAGVDEVVQRLGRPTAEHELAPGGRRLEYGGGAYGRETWMFDFDAAGRLAAVNQVRTEARFDEMRPGMTAQEVRARLGAPSVTWNVQHQDQAVWSYRYETPFCQWFMVGVTPATQRVADVAYGPDPLCARGDSTTGP